ncbi:MAG: hypothetical protein CW341_09910 [Bacteroidetes bacterium]|nr:hypothetical protein [Bacteroidota bacterium]
MKDGIFVFLTTVCILCALSFFPLYSNAQTNKLKPTWASESYHKDLDQSYLEVVVIRGESDLTKMRQMAQAEIERRRHVTVGVMGDIWMKAPHIAEYIDKDGVAYFLYQTLKKPTNIPESISTTDKYPFSARVFVPGYAQIYKGSYGKGAAFIAGEVVFIGGIVTTEFLRVNYSQKIAQTHNIKQKEYYAQNSRACAITRNVCIGGAVALYIWNIIDGAVAKGRPYVVKDGKMLTVSPYATYDCTGVAMNLKF